MDACGTELVTRTPGLACGLALVALASCQGYERRPLMPEVHRVAWHARSLEDGSLREFLARLDRDLDDRTDGFDPEDGLTLSEGQLVALAFNPNLRMARLRVGHRAATAENAGLWDDPQLSLNVLRVTESVPDPWVVVSGLSFTIPLSGRLDAERDVADARYRAAQHEALEAEWTVWFEVRRAWVEWSAAMLRVEETERFVAAMDGLVRTAAQLAESGELPRTEASLFAVEQAQRRNQLRRLSGEVAATEQRLRALMGLSPEAPVTLVPSLHTGQAVAEDSLAQLATRNPSLARLCQEYEVAEEALRHEVRKQYPDLTLGPLFENEEGQSRVGLLGAIPLPFLNANRLGIAEARVGRELARAAFETKYEILAGRWAATAALAEALADQRTDIEEVLVPLVDGQLENAVELMRLGEGSSLVLLESLTRAFQTKLELIEVRSAEGLARAELEYLTGPPDGRSTDAKEETP